MIERICPICGKPYRKVPAVSRVDNKTLICPDCGTRQALETIGANEEEQSQILNIIHEHIRNEKVPRRVPDDIYRGLPCSIVAVGNAMGIKSRDEIIKPQNRPQGLHEDGYLSLKDMNTYIRSKRKVVKKTVFKRGERPSLWQFLQTNKGEAIICLFGHFVYAKGQDYYSYFKNDDDDVVCVWYLKEE